METRSSKKRKMESEEQEITFSTSLLDLPMELLIYLGKFLKLEHIFKFRCYSRYSREVGDAMLSHRRNITITQKYPESEINLRVILQQCHNLRKITIQLDVYKKDIITDEVIENLLSNNPLLEEIEFWNMSRFTSKALAPLATKCNKLVKLIIRESFCTKFLETLNAHNNHLLGVDFNTHAKLDQFENIWEFFKNQPKLQRIVLPFMLYTVDSSSLLFDEIYDKILFTIAEICKELTYIGNLWAKNTHALRQIVDNCPELKTIQFANNARISDEMMNCLKAKNIEVEDREFDSELDIDPYYDECRECYCFDDSPPQYYDPDVD